MKNLRQATETDFKVGTTLVTQEGYEFTIYNQYDNSIFEARSSNGCRVVFVSDARFYKVLA
jgi:hypothetical protein